MTTQAKHPRPVGALVHARDMTEQISVDTVRSLISAGVDGERLVAEGVRMTTFARKKRPESAPSTETNCRMQPAVTARSSQRAAPRPRRLLCTTAGPLLTYYGLGEQFHG